jgi:hypothetical protein
MSAVVISSKPAYTAKPFMTYKRSSKIDFLKSLMNEPEIELKQGRVTEFFFTDTITNKLKSKAYYFKDLIEIRDNNLERNKKNILFGFNISHLEEQLKEFCSTHLNQIETPDYYNFEVKCYNTILDEEAVKKEFIKNIPQLNKIQYSQSNSNASSNSKKTRATVKQRLQTDHYKINDLIKQQILNFFNETTTDNISLFEKISLSLLEKSPSPSQSPSPSPSPSQSRLAKKPILTQHYIIPYSILEKTSVKTPSYFYYHFDNKTFLFIALYDQQHIINYYVEGILRELTSTHIIEYDLYKSCKKPFIYPYHYYNPIDSKKRITSYNAFLVGSKKITVNLLPNIKKQYVLLFKKKLFTKFLEILGNTEIKIIGFREKKETATLHGGIKK